MDLEKIIEVQNYFFFFLQINAPAHLKLTQYQKSVNGNHLTASHHHQF